MDNEKNNMTESGRSSLGMDENLAALLSYVFGFFSGIPIFILEKESRYVKFHAMQSIIVSIALMIVSCILGFIPILGWFVSILLTPVSLFLWIFLMVKAYKHTWLKLPVIGDIAEKQADSIKM